MPTPRDRTPAQRAADYRKTFPRRVNARRLELIGKKYGGFTEEEGGRGLDLDPAWKAEVERRVAAGLTPEEEAELADCKRALNGWETGSPWWGDRRRLLDELGARVADLRARPEGPAH